jgi:RecA-family ATPase
MRFEPFNEADRQPKPENLALFGTVDVETYFPFWTADGLRQMYGSSVEWSVDGLLPREGVAVLYGRYGCQKSFVALHYAHCVALGVPFFGKKTSKGRVVYIAAESPEDYAVRCEGWRLANGNQDTADNLIFVSNPVNFLDERQIDWFVNHDLKRMKFEPSLIVIDPLADCAIGGDENSSKDMGKVISGIQSVTRDLWALVLIVHHTGKDGQLRGHTALPSLSPLFSN